MPNKISNIARNTSYFTFALILQKIISFTYFIILARNFIPEDLGKYYTAISFTTIFAILIDLGLANVLTREVAKAKEKASEILSTALLIKLPLTIIAILSVVLLVNILDYSEIIRQLVYISIISMVLDSFAVTFYAISRGFHNLKFESFGVVIFQFIVLGFGFFVIKTGLGLKWLISAVALASIFAALYSFLVLKIKWKIKLSLKFNPALTKILIGIAIPFAMYGIFQRLYMYLDTVLLSLLAGDRFVGLYQIAFKIIFALQFLPMAFVASLYPAFASYWRDLTPGSPPAGEESGVRSKAGNGEVSQLQITLERAFNYLLVISLPISIGIIILADKIVMIFKPEYIDAVLPLRIIMASLIFIFINFPIGSLLNACDRQKRNTVNMAITLIISIILNIILIPRFQSIGASITVLITNFIMFLLGLFVVPQITKVSWRKILLIFIKTGLAVAVMGTVVYFLIPVVNIIINISISSIIYFVLLLLFKAVRKEDVFSIIGSFKK